MQQVGSQRHSKKVSLEKILTGTYRPNLLQHFYDKTLWECPWEPTCCIPALAIFLFFRICFKLRVCYDVQTMRNR